MQQILQFLREVKTEFNNISWPKKDALIQLTFVVISISTIISLILGGFDLLFTKSIGLFTQTKSQPIINSNLEQPVVTIAPQTTVAPTTIPTISKKVNKK